MSDAQEFLRKLRVTFQAEAAEHVQAIVSDIVQLERSGGGAPAPGAQRILKALHTLKGAARAVDLGDLEQLCHAMEGLCSAWLKRPAPPPQAQFDLLHQACGLLGQMAVQSTGRLRNQAQALVRTLDKLAESEHAAAPAAPTEHVAQATPEAGPVTEEAPAAPARHETLRIDGRDLDMIRYQTESLLSVELSLQHQVAHLHELASQMLQDADREQGRFFEQVRQASSRVHGAVSRLATIRGRLMDTVLDTAMVPFSTALDPLPGMVRNLARSRGKEAALAVRGDSIPVDRRILEIVREAVLHLVTNAVDHGIEPVESRRAAGKPDEGQVKITVEQAGSDRVRLLVEDDGAGIDVDAVVAAASDEGGTASMTPEQLSALDAAQRLQLVLRAGVSTSREVTQVSGRGVGLAIVAEKVAALDGELLLDSRPGRGTRFELLLPVRVSTLRALVVRCADAEYALPLHGLEAVQKLAEGAIVPVQGRDALVREGRVLPLVRLGQLLGQGAPAETGAVAVIARSGVTQFALLVDEIVTEQAIVPKSLGRLLRRVRYFSGATQLGSGALVPVLALDDIARHALAGGTTLPAGGTAPAAHRAPRVLAVEDSVTSRLLLKHILEGAGFEVETAVDGMDAQSRLRTASFAAVVSDVEMPRLDGLGLTRWIRENPNTRDLPVVLVTSLQTAEERERGMQAGADAYVVKGAFDQDNLLATLRRLM